MSWRQQQKSPFLASGGHWLQNEQRLLRKGKLGFYNEYHGRLKCPICGETETNNLIERRRDFWECRSCGYIEDVAMWDASISDAEKLAEKRARKKFPI